jgi:hypothetical protein
MPNIQKTFNFTTVPIDQLYIMCHSIFTEMGVIDLQQTTEPDNQSIWIITGVSPSMWGWGGMQIGVKIWSSVEGTSTIEVFGYIAQLSVTPLTEKMDEFLLKLQGRLLAEYSYDFQYEKLTRFLPKYAMQFTKIDGIVLVLVLTITFVSVLVGALSRSGGVILIGPILGLGYFLGKKFLFGSMTSKD